MPNYRAVRNSQSSGMKKCEEQPVDASANTTYVETPPAAPPKKKTSLVDNVPIDKPNAGKIPTAPTPLGTVNVGPVSGKASK